MTCDQGNAAGKTILLTEKREWSVLEIHSETRDMFSTLVPSGGEMTKEPLYVFSVLFRNAEREHSPFMSFLERKQSEFQCFEYGAFTFLLQFLQSVYFFYLKYKGQNCTVTLHIFRNCAKNERWYSVFYTVLRSCETQMQNELPEK